MKTVPKDYVANSETETILYGEQLRNGMKVLVARSSERNITYSSAWCTVSNVRGAGTIDFVGLYEDGSLYPRSYGFTTPWIVKLDSIPAS